MQSISSGLIAFFLGRGGTVSLGGRATFINEPAPLSSRIYVRDLMGLAEAQTTDSLFRRSLVALLCQDDKSGASAGITEQLAYSPFASYLQCNSFLY